MESNNEFDYANFEKEAIKGLYLVLGSDTVQFTVSKWIKNKVLRILVIPLIAFQAFLPKGEMPGRQWGV